MTGVEGVTQRLSVGPQDCDRAVQIFSYIQSLANDLPLHSALARLMHCSLRAELTCQDDKAKPPYKRQLRRKQNEHCKEIDCAHGAAISPVCNSGDGAD